MPDYIYLFENRLTAGQQHALHQLREAAREAGTILFLTGDVVRDLTNGQAARNLEVSIHGNALKLKKTIEKLGGKVWGEDEESRSLYLCFPGTVLVDLISTHRVEYPKPGKRVYVPASIHEDLRRRDFTVNAMAISLNEGSFGLLMDPLNGAADIESRTLRLVSNYGFLEEPSLLIRATRYLARLGWELDPKTLTRYENAKGEGVIEFLSPLARRQELEEIGHEEDGLKVLQALDAEGWMKSLYPAWTAAKADEEKLKALRTLAAELHAEGVRADMSAAQTQLLTAKLAGKEVAALKKLMLRPGFVEEWSSLDAQAARFAKVLLSRENAVPSAAYKLFRSYDPEAVLWLGFISKDAAVRERFNQFLKVWPEARQRIPHALMQEMRITPELPVYPVLIETIFLELIDGRLTTPEEFRAFLEPHSPPAPPPHVAIKRPRVKRGAEAKVKDRSYDDDEEAEDASEEDLDDTSGDEDEIGLGMAIPKIDLGHDLADGAEHAEDELEDEEHEPAPAPVKTVKHAANVKGGKAIALKPAKAEKPQPAPKAIPEAKPAPTPAAAPAKGKPAPAPSKAAAAPAVKKAAAKTPAKAPVIVKAKTPVKAPVKVKARTPVKAPVKVKAKTPAKAPVKAKAKTPAKALVKVKAKTPAKSKLSAGKSKPAKGMKASKASSKSSKGAKAKKPDGKKAGNKKSKKR